MKTMWYVCSWKTTPERVTVIKETAKFITTDRDWGGRRAKITEDGGFFDTWDDAIKWLLDYHKSKRNNLLSHAARVDARISAVESLTPPEGVE